MRNIDTIPIIIKDYENVDYGMDVSDFLWAVRDELTKYIPKLERFAKTHTKEKCHIKTGTWWNEGRIYDKGLNYNLIRLKRLSINPGALFMSDGMHNIYPDF